MFAMFEGGNDDNDIFMSLGSQNGKWGQTASQIYDIAKC